MDFSPSRGGWVGMGSSSRGTRVGLGEINNRILGRCIQEWGNQYCNKDYLMGSHNKFLKGFKIRGFLHSFIEAHLRCPLKFLINYPNRCPTKDHHRCHHKLTTKEILNNPPLLEPSTTDLQQCRCLLLSNSNNCNISNSSNTSSISNSISSYNRI
jgi:hypothetical protein